MQFNSGNWIANGLYSLMGGTQQRAPEPFQKIEAWPYSRWLGPAPIIITPVTTLGRASATWTRTPTTCTKIISEAESSRNELLVCFIWGYWWVAILLASCGMLVLVNLLVQHHVMMTNCEELFTWMKNTRFEIRLGIMHYALISNCS